MSHHQLFFSWQAWICAHTNLESSNIVTLFINYDVIKNLFITLEYGSAHCPYYGLSDSTSLFILSCAKLSASI